MGNIWHIHYYGMFRIMVYSFLYYDCIFFIMVYALLRVMQDVDHEPQ